MLNVRFFMQFKSGFYCELKNNFCSVTLFPKLPFKYAIVHCRFTLLFAKGSVKIISAVAVPKVEGLQPYNNPKLTRKVGSYFFHQLKSGLIFTLKRARLLQALLIRGVNCNTLRTFKIQYFHLCNLVTIFYSFLRFNDFLYTV